MHRLLRRLANSSRFYHMAEFSAKYRVI
uniref:Uncharacterized protein n=1 Tax=Zea mays TaxID=4577 RepID=C0PAH8_MAIZE|nr:unknown [Zea mays]